MNNSFYYWPKPAHMIRSIPVRREKSGTRLQCVWQRVTRTIETLMVFQPKWANANSPHYQSQAFFPKHVIPKADRNSPAPMALYGAFSEK